MRIAGREELERDEDCGDKKDNGDGNPHQCGGALLIFERRKCEHSGRGNIGRIDDAVTK